MQKLTDSPMTCHLAPFLLVIGQSADCVTRAFGWWAQWIWEQLPEATDKLFHPAKHEIHDGRPWIRRSLPCMWRILYFKFELDRLDSFLSRCPEMTDVFLKRHTASWYFLFIRKILPILAVFYSRRVRHGPSFLSSPTYISGMKTSSLPGTTIFQTEPTSELWISPMIGTDSYPGHILSVRSSS